MQFFTTKGRRAQILVPVLFALALTVPVILLLPDLYPKYRAELVESGFIDKPGGFDYYEDLDHDGFSEKVVVFNNTQNEASIKIMEEDGSIGDHYYFRGKILKNKTQCSFCDYDSSGITRIFLFTVSNDSLLLHVVDPVREKRALMENRFIGSVTPKNGIFDFEIKAPLFDDLDGDGIREMVTTIMAGFPLKPRVGLVLDMAKDSLFISADKGRFFFIGDILDINGDGRKELFPMTYSIWNYPDSIPDSLGDHTARAGVMNSRFEYLFPPVELTGKYIHTYTYPVKRASGEYRLITLLRSRGEGLSCSRLRLTDISGNLLREQVLSDSIQKQDLSLFTLPDQPEQVFLLTVSGDLYALNDELDTVRHLLLDWGKASYWFSEDLDLDGAGERYGFTGFQPVPTIFRSDFSDPVRLDYIPGREPVYFRGIRKRDAERELLFQQGEQYYLVAYGKNPWFFLKYPVYAGIYLGFLGIILLSQYLQRVLIKRRLASERKIADLQLLVLRNQLDPHFTFNAISSMSSLILSREPQEANRLLISLSKLMRLTVTRSESLSWSLAEELDFLQHYLTLMECRMEADFRWLVEVAPEVSLYWQMPKMVTQIYAENAIKHGLLPKGVGGKLEISICSRQLGVGSPESTPHQLSKATPGTFRDHYVTISIVDNGIGRQAAREAGTQGTGRGIAIMEQFFETFNRSNAQKIHYAVTDLEDDTGKPAGTRVEITIPVGEGLW